MTHGYLVRCEDPQTPGHYVVGRAIAAGGETVTFDQEVVSIDGHRTPSGHACDTAQRTGVYDPETGAEEELGCAVEEYGEADFEVLLSRIDPHPSTPRLVEPGTWFLVSDNRHIHDDSRDSRWRRPPHVPAPGRAPPRDVGHRASLAVVTSWTRGRRRRGCPGREA